MFFAAAATRGCFLPSRLLRLRVAEDVEVFSPLSPRGKMDFFYSRFVAQQTSSLKGGAIAAPLTHPPLSAARAGPSLLAVKEGGGGAHTKKKRPRRDNSGHIDVMASCFKKRQRPSDVPHAGFYGDNLR